MKIVVDTNVLVAGLLNPNGTPAQILNLLINGKITFLYDNRVLQEYIEVLRRNKFGFKQEWIEPLLEFIKNGGEYITPESTNHIFTDEDDKAFYEVAIAGEAEYLITGNKRHFPKERRIINPKEFMEILGKEKEKK